MREAREPYTPVGHVRRNVRRNVRRLSQSLSPFSASFQTSCFTTRAYSKTSKYGLFCVYNQRRLCSSSQRIMGRIIKELSYNDTARTISAIHPLLPMLATIVLEFRIFWHKKFIPSKMI